MRIRKFIAENDHATVAEWWQGHGWPVVPPHLLPPYGIIVDGLCAGWLYKTDSRIGWLEWVVSNPKASAREVYDGMVMMFDLLKEESKRRGDAAIFSALKSRGLIRFYKNQGFEESDSGMTHMVLRW